MDSKTYASPNSPIASSKRARTRPDVKVATTPKSTVGTPKSAHLASPAPAAPSSSGGNGSNSLLKQATTAKKDAVPPSINPNAAKSSSSSSKAPQTPSKIMFAPGPRRDPDGNIIADSNSANTSVDVDAVASASVAVSPCPSSDNTVNDQGIDKGEQVDGGHEEDEEGEDEDEEDEEDYDDVFNPYQFIAGLPDHKAVQVPNKIVLPPLPPDFPKDKLTLVLDLDETLVHCTVDPVEKPDLIFPVSFNGTNYQVYVRKRPYLDHFLEAVSKTFEVVLFTASQKVYADVLMNQIDTNKWVKHRLFRESCLLVQGNYLKDLTVLGRDLSKTLLVDNSPHAYGYQVDNGIPIESWYDDPTDTELLKLIGFLKRVQGAKDVQPIVHEHFKTYKLVEDSRAGKRVSLTTPPF